MDDIQFRDAIGKAYKDPARDAALKVRVSFFQSDSYSSPGVYSPR